MLFIVRVIACDGHTSAVDEAIELQRCAQNIDLLNDLLHLAVCQRIVVQSVNTAVIFKKDVCPVLEQLLFSFVPQNLRFPAAGGGKHID